MIRSESQGLRALCMRFAVLLAVAPLHAVATAAVYLPDPIYEAEWHARGSDFSGAADAVQRVDDPYPGFSPNHYRTTGPLS